VPDREHLVNQKRNNITTPQEYVKIVAESWLELPGIENVPQFHDICRRVVENDDAWLTENWDAVRGVQSSSEVRLLLIKQGATNLLTLMDEAAEATEPEVREAASKALAARNNDVQELLEAQAATMKAIDDVIQRFEWLGRNGWTLPLHIDIAATRRFHDLILCPNVTVQDVEQWFIGHYESGGLADISNDLLSSRHLLFWKTLIEQCLRAFERKDYQICIPSLLLIFEGVIAKALDLDFQNPQTHTKFFKRKIEAASTRPAEQFLWKSVKAFAEEVFKAVSAKRTHPVLKRHLILHGKSHPSTWGEADCLRLLQAIFTIIFLLNQLARDK
jgi:hypothetical protein